MPNPDWTAITGTPQILLAGNQRTWPSDIITTKMDAGPAKKRQRSTAAVTPGSGECRVNGTTRDAIWTFYVTSCAGGSLPFDWTDPYVGGTTTVMFSGPPVEVKVAPDSYILTINWETQP